MPERVHRNVVYVFDCDEDASQAQVHDGASRVARKQREIRQLNVSDCAYEGDGPSGFSEDKTVKQVPRFLIEEEKKEHHLANDESMQLQDPSLNEQGPKVNRLIVADFK